MKPASQSADVPARRDSDGGRRVDGLGYGGIYRYIVLPSSRGSMMILGMITFMHSWNTFLWLLIIAQTSIWWTVQVVLSTFLTAYTINLLALFISAAIVGLPLVLFIAAQHDSVEALAPRGIKG